jgi:hypothetical protein
LAWASVYLLARLITLNGCFFTSFVAYMCRLLLQIMRAKGLGGEVIYYPEATHGWTIRGDLSNPKVKADVNDAYERAILFFAIHVPRA